MLLSIQHQSCRVAVEGLLCVGIGPTLPLGVFLCGLLMSGLQIENEYGYYNRSDASYLRHLAAKARQHLGPHVLLYTTDLAREDVLDRGTLPGRGSAQQPTVCTECIEISSLHMQVQIGVNAE